MLAEGKYFTVAPTACTIRSRGALAIYCGDLPKKNPDGTTTHSLAAPLLLMPQEMWGDPTDTMAKIAGVLNDNAHLFFSSAQAPSKARTDVLAERARQISGEGWTPEHDDEHSDGALARAAGCYAWASQMHCSGHDPYSAVLSVWPWSRAWLKPTEQRRDLVKAGALILAEIERLDRAEARAKAAEAGHERG